MLFRSDVIIVPYLTIETTIRRIAETPDDAIAYQKVLLRGQGLDVP